MSGILLLLLTISITAALCPYLLMSIALTNITSLPSSPFCSGSVVNRQPPTQRGGASGLELMLSNGHCRFGAPVSCHSVCQILLGMPIWSLVMPLLDLDWISWYWGHVWWLSFELFVLWYILIIWISTPIILEFVLASEDRITNHVIILLVIVPVANWIYYFVCAYPLSGKKLRI
jgi:hypothetical protein